MTNAPTWAARLAAWPPRRAVFVSTTAWLFVQAAISSASVTSDLTRRGVRFDAGEPWIWEYSSAASLLLWLVPLLAFDDALRARTVGRVPRVTAYALASVAFSVAHVVTMVALRHVAYAALGWHYDFGSWRGGLLYEYRKDVLSVALMLLGAAAWRRWARHEAAPPVAIPVVAPVAVEVPAAEPDVAPAAIAVPPPTFMTRTATQGDLLVRGDEIDWVEAQGNYVALHVGDEVRLLRRTLAEMETRLQAHGFIRTHRRALVNRARMQAILTPDLGEPGVRLVSGQVAPLSVSRRAAVLRLVLDA